MINVPSKDNPIAVAGIINQPYADAGLSLAGSIKVRQPRLSNTKIPARQIMVKASRNQAVHLKIGLFRDEVWVCIF